MSGALEQSIYSAITAVIGFVLGAFSPPIKRWWNRRHARQDAARALGREFADARRIIAELASKLDPERGLDSRWLAGAVEKLARRFDGLSPVLASRVDLRADEVERSVSTMFEELSSFRDRMIRFSRRPSVFVAGQDPDTGLALRPLIEQNRGIAVAHLESLDRLLAQLRALERWNY